VSAVLEAEGGLFRLKGPVTIATAASLYRDIQARLGDKSALPEVVTLDCTGIDAADSAALALLIEARRNVTAQGKRLEVVGLRAHLASLARIYGVDWLLLEAPQGNS